MLGARGSPGSRALRAADDLPRSEALDFNHSASTRCTSWMQIEPSPTADATRLTLFARTSPTANTPGRLVSNRYGARASGQCVSARSVGVRPAPALMKFLASSLTQPRNHSVLGDAPVIMNTWRIAW